MDKITVTDQSASKRTAELSAGDCIHLAPGRYTKPLVIEGKTGRRDAPIIISPSDDPKAQKGEVIFTSGIDRDAARKRLNEVAYRKEQAGFYPNVGQVGDEAMLILRNCQYVIVHGLTFDGCRPGGIYLNECQNILIHDCKFIEGTIAIGANGTTTRDIIVQECSWTQDTSTHHDMWNKVPWGRIHGASDNSEVPGVDVKNDFRHWDGDFFRAWSIRGNVTIRKNVISDAFNGIHFFNKRDDLSPGVDAASLTFNDGRQASINVLIEDNTFVRVRDNVFEPEKYAWNWVIRNNRFKDCYRPFSFEFERAGWFYIYGNQGAMVEKPSQKMTDDDKIKYPQSERRESVSMFKPKGTQANEGPIYIFNNSWYMKTGKGIFPKFAIGRLQHFNNAMQFDRTNKAKMLGNDTGIPSPSPIGVDAEKKAESRRFTRRWIDYRIEMDGDMSNDDLYPTRHQALGVRIGLSARHKDPRFKDPESTDQAGPDFKPRFFPKRSGVSIDFEMGFPFAESKTISASPSGNQVAGFPHVGAIQRDPFDASELDALFGFLPSTNWIGKQKVEHTADKLDTIDWNSKAPDEQST